VAGDRLQAAEPDPGLLDVRLLVTGQLRACVDRLVLAAVVRLVVEHHDPRPAAAPAAQVAEHPGDHRLRRLPEL